MGWLNKINQVWIDEQARKWFVAENWKKLKNIQELAETAKGIDTSVVDRYVDRLKFKIVEKSINPAYD